MADLRAAFEQNLERLAARLRAEAAADPFGQRQGYTYLIGVYLGLNALRDAYMLVEGPDCAYMKAQYIHGNHDWCSTLTSVSGYHRLANTALHPAKMTASRERPVRELMLGLAGHEAVGGLLVSSLPMAFITGADYQRICREVREATGTEVIHVQGLSLRGDWLDGYAEVLKAFAHQLELPSRRPDPRSVAVVGYLYDRNEEDHRANLRELQGLCAALDLDLVSVWLAGQNFAELARVAEAGTILSLPYGRAAARQLARRTGAQVIELPLPFGLRATDEWLDTLGRRFKRERAAAAYRDRHLREIIPRLEWLVPFAFQNLPVGYVGDPHLYPGFRDIVELLGARSAFAVFTNLRGHCKALTATLPAELPVLVDPRLKGFANFVLEHVRREHVGLLVTNNAGFAVPLHETAYVEFGFPSLYTHALFERPFLFHRGFMAFVDTLTNALRHKELELARFQALTSPLLGGGELA